MPSADAARWSVSEITRMSRIGDICFHASTYPTDGARSIMFLEVFFFLSGLPHNGVLPCRPFVARSCSHWLFFRLSGSQCWLTVHQYQLPSANWSPSMTGRSQRHPSDLMVILFRVCTCHIPKEVGPSLLNKVGNWRTTGNLSDSEVGDVFCVQDPEDFMERPCVKSMDSPG